MLHFNCIQINDYLPMRMKMVIEIRVEDKICFNYMYGSEIYEVISMKIYRIYQ